MLPEKRIFAKTNQTYIFWGFFVVFLCGLIYDRILSLTHFGFLYTDIDQVILWNGALDYSKGIFHEPFFYGQNYNYMLESFLAIPLIWLDVPLFKALPLVTTFLAIFPFVILALFFMRDKLYFWAFICLTFPLFLPLEFNFLTTISRGNVQANLFIPLLFFALFNSKNKLNIFLFFIGFALSLIANPGSILVLIVISIIVWSKNFTSKRFYLSSLIMLPIFWLNYLAKQYYVVHEERLLHQIMGLKLDKETFLKSISTTNHFDFLFPFFSSWGAFYFILLIGLLLFTFRKKMQKEPLVIGVFLALLIITLAVPKIQADYSNAGIFFTPSRLYLALPLGFILCAYYVFRNKIFSKYWMIGLFILTFFSFSIKNKNINDKVENIVKSTSFPVFNNKFLAERIDETHQVVDKYKVDLVIGNNELGLGNVTESYVYHLIGKHANDTNSKVIYLNQTGDRRTWEYDKAEKSKRILLNWFTVDSTLLEKVNYTEIQPYRYIIQTEGKSVTETLAKLNLKFGAKVDSQKL